MTDPKAIARASFRLIETGDPELARQIIAPDFVNQEAEDDPDEVERQQLGPAGFLATSRWLRDTFSNLRFELQETLAEGGTVMAAAVMTGQHTGSFNGIAPTGRPITHKQVHIFTIADGQINRHRAVRDDLGLLLHLGSKLVNNARAAAATSSSNRAGMGSS
jgi:predicted ester cyclase